MTKLPDTHEVSKKEFRQKIGNRVHSGSRTISPLCSAAWASAEDRDTKTAKGGGFSISLGEFLRIDYAGSFGSRLSEHAIPTCRFRRRNSFRPRRHSDEGSSSQLNPQSHHGRQVTKIEAEEPESEGQQNDGRGKGEKPHHREQATAEVLGVREEVAVSSVSPSEPGGCDAPPAR